MRDFREAARGLLRSPGYALTVVAVLAIGIGVNIVAFGFYLSIALSPIPGVSRSGDLHVIASTTQGDRLERLSHHDYQYLRDHLRAYRTLAGTGLHGFTLGRGADAIRIYGELVTSAPIRPSSAARFTSTPCR